MAEERWDLWNALKGDIEETITGIGQLPNLIRERGIYALADMGRGLVESYKNLFTHPVETFKEDPLFTILDLIPLVGAAGKVARGAKLIDLASETGAIGRLGELIEDSTVPVRVTGNVIERAPTGLTAPMKLPIEVTPPGLDPVSGVAWLKVAEPPMIDNELLAYKILQKASPPIRYPGVREFTIPEGVSTPRGFLLDEIYSPRNWTPMLMEDVDDLLTLDAALQAAPRLSTTPQMRALALTDMALSNIDRNFYNNMFIRPNDEILAMDFSHVFNRTHGLQSELIRDVVDEAFTPEEVAYLQRLKAAVDELYASDQMSQSVADYLSSRLDEMLRAGKFLRDWNYG